MTSLDRPTDTWDLRSCLPEEDGAVMVGRADFGAGPTPILLRSGEIFDLSSVAPTVADLFDTLEPGDVPEGKLLGSYDSLSFRPAWDGLPAEQRLLAPIDLQCIKAAGVTFAVSTLERVIEERAGGDALRAREIRQALSARVGGDLRQVRPNSEAAQRLKVALISDGLWSQYLEVAIGPDAEIFTKAPPLSAVGWGEQIGVRSDSHWNNPEPEIVLICDRQGRTRGACLGNDVNLRDFEGRSALLLGKAKDNNASCALGPFIRLFDAHYALDDVRRALVQLHVKGDDGFILRGESSMREISRDPLELVSQTFGEHHSYPDGFALFLGTMFAPTADRDAPGRGFTHKGGDLVEVASPRLGRLINRVAACSAAPAWTFGVGALMRNLAARGLLSASTGS